MCDRYSMLSCNSYIYSTCQLLLSICVFLPLRLQPTCTSNAQVKPLSECGAAVKDGCGGTCELKCASASQCMFGTQTFVEIRVCVPTPEPSECSAAACCCVPVAEPHSSTSLSPSIGSGCLVLIILHIPLALVVCAESTYYGIALTG